MNYWILEKPKANAKAEIRDGKLYLSNSLIERIVDIKKGTTSYKNLSCGYQLISEVSCDTYFKVDGKELQLYRDFEFKGYEYCNCIEDIHYEKKAFNCTDFPYPPKGSAIRLTYKNETLKVEIVYEIFEGLPAICKRAYLTNLTGNTLVLNQYTLENLKLQSKFADYLYGECNYNGGSMLGGSSSLSVHQKTDSMVVEFEAEIDVDIKADEVFEGMRVYELLHTAKYYEQRYIEIKEMYRRLFVWVNDAPLIFHILSDRNYKIKAAVDMMKEVGFDMIIQSFGSHLNMENLSNRYVERHKKLYEYAHSKGIGMGGYTLAIVKNYRPIHSAECNVFADPKGRIYRCLASEWSERYWKTIYEFCERTKMDSIEIDGPYHFYQCTGGPTHNHKGLKDSRYIQWKKSTVEMLKTLKSKNMYVNAPDWLFFSGSNRTGIGYEEIAFSEPRMNQIAASRIYNYKGTFGKIPSMAWSFLPINVYHGGGKKACFSPLEENVKDYEWMVFQHFVSGVIPCFRGKKLFEGEKSKAVIKKWTEFYNKYKPVINGITVHCLPPVLDPKNAARTTGLDIILNELPYGETRGVLAIFNQTDKEITQKVQIPLFYTGLCGTDKLPLPLKNCSIGDVKNPSYGEYPPPYPVYSEEDLVKGDLATGMGEGSVITKEIYHDNVATLTKNKATFRQEDNSKGKKLSIDSNCNCELTVKLKAMSYTWYIITAES